MSALYEVIYRRRHLDHMDIKSNFTDKGEAINLFSNLAMLSDVDFVRLKYNGETIGWISGMIASIRI